MFERKGHPLVLRSKESNRVLIVNWVFTTADQHNERTSNHMVSPRGTIEFIQG